MFHILFGDTERVLCTLRRIWRWHARTCNRSRRWRWSFQHLGQRLFTRLLWDRAAPMFPVRVLLRLRTHFDQRVARPGESWGHRSHLCETTSRWIMVCLEKALKLSMAVVRAVSSLSLPLRRLVYANSIPWICLTWCCTTSHAVPSASRFMKQMRFNNGNLLCVFSREARTRHKLVWQTRASGAAGDENKHL